MLWSLHYANSYRFPKYTILLLLCYTSTSNGLVSSLLPHKYPPNIHTNIHKHNQYMIDSLYIISYIIYCLLITQHTRSNSSNIIEVFVYFNICTVCYT